jgi:AmmeMemoRadiSam system protein B
VDAIQTRGAWVTPLGSAPIAQDVAEAILAHCPRLHDGADNFVGEHSIEVQVPFLQHLYGAEVPIVPIMMLDQDLSAARAVGQALATALAGRDVVMVASTDMTHFEPPEIARRQDEILIERMEALDPEGLLRERERRGITMCGYGPVAAMLTAARELGAVRAQRLCYTNSGEVGPRDEVVAYLSLAVWRG